VIFAKFFTDIQLQVVGSGPCRILVTGTMTIAAVFGDYSCQSDYSRQCGRGLIKTVTSTRTLYCVMARRGRRVVWQHYPRVTFTMQSRPPKTERACKRLVAVVRMGGGDEHAWRATSSNDRWVRWPAVKSRLNRRH